MKRIKAATLAVVVTGLALAASTSWAAPIVTARVTRNIGGTPDTAWDFFYSAGLGAEFTVYDLIANFQTHAIRDPNREPIRGGVSGQSSTGGVAIDTWANTVGSFLGVGPASYSHTTYNPRSRWDNPPVSRLYWTVFDTLEGDHDGLGSGAPYHIARLLLTPGATGSVEFRAYNNLSGSTPTLFNFTIPEPASLGMALAGVAGLIGARRRFPATPSSAPHDTPSQA